MPNPFSQFLDGAKEIFAGSGDGSVVGVDIGSSSIKVVQLKRKQGVLVLETYGELTLGPFAGQEAGQIVQLNESFVPQALTSILTESKVTAQKMFLSTRSASSLMFVLSVPPVSDRELASLLPNEVRKYIPVPVSEVSLDWWIIPEREDIAPEDQKGTNAKKREVLVTAVHNDTMRMYGEIVQQAHITPAGYEIEMFSAVRSSVRHDYKPSLVIDFGASATRVAIIEYGVVRAFHTIARGSHHISHALSASLGIPFTQAENKKKEIGLLGSGPDADVARSSEMTVSVLFSEMQRIVMEYERTYGRAIDHVVLTGGGSLLKGFEERVRETFRADVARAQPFRKTKAPQFLEGTLGEVGPTFSVAVGLALRGVGE